MLGICRALGEIDMSNAAAFSADLHDTIDNSNDALVSVDCSGVTFMGSAGYRVLVDATNYAARHGHTLVLRNLSSSCSMLIGICDVDRELRIER